MRLKVSNMIGLTFIISSANLNLAATSSKSFLSSSVDLASPFTVPNNFF